MCVFNNLTTAVSSTSFTEFSTSTLVPDYAMINVIKLCVTLTVPLHTIVHTLGHAVTCKFIELTFNLISSVERLKLME